MNVTPEEAKRLEELREFSESAGGKYYNVVIPSQLFLKLLRNANPVVPRRCKHCNGIIERGLCVSCRLTERY